MNKENVVQIYNGILFSHKKNPVISRNMNRTGSNYVK
jgi:hypothetical protein